MDDRDRELLNLLQAGLPLTAQPFAVLGARLGLKEDEVIARLELLKAKGVLRRLGAILVPQAWGYASLLCAAEVPEEQVERFAAAVNRLPEVTHNYLRDGSPNVWFTLVAPSLEELERLLQRIKRETGIEEIWEFPATETFKIRVKFDL